MVTMIKHIRVKSALSKSGLKELDYSLNPYMGCKFKCQYCYAPNFTRDVDASKNWGEVIVIKDNILDILKEEVLAKKKGTVGISTITDPYQPVEAEYKLTRGSLDILLSHGFRVSIQTKSPLVLRDIDILKKFKEKVDVGFTITSMEGKLENAPLPRSRITALEKLSEEGIETWVFLGPIIPNFTDNVEEVIREVSKIKTRIVFDKFRYYKGLNFSEGNSVWWENIRDRILSLCKKYNVECHEESEDWIFEKRRKYKILW
ncbi:radical SAM protein [Acidianus brierleyi]|uniref:Radical SAM protein n=2 Tax=Acidianus brierleyi TaxID=41673 RepID=A0A2U9ICN1_9CREN|nr:radical SAM protein [Acidianus brierleyi]AWR93785.1 radical SAM protein [Acidianus brierleyi]